MGRSTVHYADNETNNILKRLHNKLRPAGTPVQRVDYIIELLLLRIFEVKLKHDTTFKPLRKQFEGENYRLLFSHLLSLNGDEIKLELNKNFFPFYSTILSKAKEVFTGNLPQKIQDQLVLIEEVFANSSFTTNVQSGNMSEIISLVAEIDEERVLKTDLLGDAIESSLSETGGTKDIGLYRTPEHIRQMMVAMVDPKFTDVIFDPACGTGGFLFDAYQYVLEKATHDGKWPNSKTHSEVKNYFKEKYFSKFHAEMPSIDIVNAFYRHGISGIEYLGMIRKMAAINLYIRGLNPANIEQGDSLKNYNPSIDAGTKTIVIANPPFGAERDQPAYPNVWEEYSKESETTILFVKLMFDLLQKQGRCAVVVSEGFLTWDQSSARALRKLLLDEANLRAIISLPQGVFVSKSGQGAKTSILYFEKGEPTKYVWHYKITNDGYSMGINRKEIPDSQVPEVIDLFIKYVKAGKIPTETQNSFVVPASWIKQLDPRIAQRIKTETKEEFSKKSKSQREKLISQLKDKFTKKKIDKKTYEEKLWQFDNVWDNKTQNEISKRTEKANNYSFNLQNYRSGLSYQQIQEWTKMLGQFNKNFLSVSQELWQAQKQMEKSLIKPALEIQKTMTKAVEPLLEMQANLSQIYENAINPIKKSYEKLVCLAGLNPLNSLHIDIVRDALSKLDQHKDEIIKLTEILKKGQKYPFVKLGEIIIENKERIKPNKYPEDEFVILGVSNETGVFVNEKKQGKKINQNYFKVGKNQFCYNPYRINVGSIGLNTFEFKNQIISGAYIVFGVDENKILPEFLYSLFKNKRFLDYVNEKATGGVRMNFKIDYLKDWQIPLPTIEEQKEIVEKIEKQKQIIEGAGRIKEGFEIKISVDFETVEIGTICELIYGEPLPEKNRTDGEYPVYGAGNIIGKHCKYITENPAIIIGRRGATSGTVMFCNNHCWVIDTAFFVLVKEKYVDEVNFKYLFYALKSLNLFKYQSGGAMPGVNRNDIYGEKIPLPPLETQRQIVEEIDKEIEALEKVKFLKHQAEKRIEEILDKIWKS